VCNQLPFEPHDIAAQLDSRGHYEVELAAEFPLLIKLFRFSSRRHTRGVTWHERLELFLPLDDITRFRMGDQEVALNPGELLVVDNLKLHHVVDFPGFETRVIVISFRPEFVYTLGSPSHDYAFLLPFYSKPERRAHVLRNHDESASSVHGALARLLQCYFCDADKPFYQAGAKACLLELLYHLAVQFRSSAMVKWEFVRQQERSLRLKKLFDHITARPAERLPLGAASRLVGMTPAQFMRAFKQVAGMTLVAYLNHVRLSRAARLLVETHQTVGEIAYAAGFSDQSYFDKLFKRSFGATPVKFRAQAWKSISS
jgi:AraC-like DNA-binding protein